MEKQWSALEIVITALAGIAGLVLMTITLRSKSKSCRPPGPTPWPVIGNLHQLGLLPHQTLAHLAKKYGPLMFLKFGSVDVVVASSPRVVEQFLKTHDIVWASRAVGTAAGRILCYNYNELAYLPYGARWRYARKVFTEELFKAQRLADFQKSRKEVVLSAVNTLFDKCSGGKTVRMDWTLGTMSTNIATKMLAKNCVLSSKSMAIKDSPDFQQTIKDAFVLSGVLNIGDYIPWLDRFDLQGYKKKMTGVGTKYDAFLQSVLDDHREKLKRNAAQNIDTVVDEQDIVDVLLTRPSDVDGQNLSDEERKALMQDVIMASTDTVANTIEWCLSELIKNPRLLGKAQAEMDSVIGRERIVEESDLPNLPYLQAVVKETFRLHPVAPLLAPHQSSEESEIDGYRLPANTRLFVNVWAIQRDPEVWDRPLEFYPERFFDTTKDIHGQHFELLPFGTGRRMCPGKNLGLLMIQYILAVLIQACDWRLAPGQNPDSIDRDEKFGLTLPRLNTLRAIATPRVPRQLVSSF